MMQFILTNLFIMVIVETFEVSAASDVVYFCFLFHFVHKLLRSVAVWFPSNFP